ncbi:hypothetical protein NX059_012025 [Plenodomus lindquistii]|nr:hypothetical protein NX059_012025 [Plenodomus lindquistii]
MNPSLTTKQFINVPLPSLSRDPKEYKPSKSSGSTTYAMNPPSKLIYKNVQAYLVEADNAFNLRCTQHLCKNPYTLPPPFIELTTEMDTVSNSTIYIIGVISHVLSAMFPSQWTCKNEDSQLVEFNEQAGSKSTTVRCDTVFRKLLPDGSKGGVMAIIEYKRLPQLKYKDFEPAIVTQNPPNGTPQHGFNATAIPSSICKLQLNGLSFTKQVAGYARHTSCKYTALYDWDHLLLFNFHELAQTSDEKSAGRSALLTWVFEKNGLGRGRMQRACIRQALLGYLIQAFKEAGLVPTA